MTPETPSFDGPNGRYNICFDCAQMYGYKYKEPRVMGVWAGTCDICGAKRTGLTNAYHDWGLTNAECAAIKARLDSANR